MTMNLSMARCPSTYLQGCLLPYDPWLLLNGETRTLSLCNEQDGNFLKCPEVIDLIHTLIGQQLNFTFWA